MGTLSGASVLVTGATGFVEGDEVAVASDLADPRRSTWRDAGLEAFDVV